MSNYSAKMKEYIKSHKKRTTVIGLLIVLVFTMYQFDEENCHSTELYGPSFGDTYLVERFSCFTNTKGGWLQRISPVPIGFSRSTDALVFNNGEDIIQRWDIRDKHIPVGIYRFEDKLFSARYVGVWSDERIVSIDEDGTIHEYADLSDIPADFYTVIAYHDNELFFVTNFEEIYSYSISNDEFLLVDDLSERIGGRFSFRDMGTNIQNDELVMLLSVVFYNQGSSEVDKEGNLISYDEDPRYLYEYNITTGELSDLGKLHEEDIENSFVGVSRFPKDTEETRRFNLRYPFHIHSIIAPKFLSIDHLTQKIR